MLGERHEPLQGASEKKQVTGTPFLYEESEPSDLKLQETFFFVINFVDYSLNQGAPAGHESAETPIGHESTSIPQSLFHPPLLPPSIPQAAFTDPPATPPVPPTVPSPSQVFITISGSKFRGMVLLLRTLNATHDTLFRKMRDIRDQQDRHSIILDQHTAILRQIQ
ncbi:hypothetical protein CK203_064781 [Vitis vinifera]|uniref:Uncharacterized protein n=1 Tax=Vitis vinifera TaxID=29760 RepID=A0A438FQ09_VITVI|nr:hypothetical protein CK203_064781 [Vitis vinifera]